MEINYSQTELIEITFSREGVVILNDLFTEKSLLKLKSEVNKLKFKRDFELPHHSYNSAELNINSKKLSNSKELLKFLSKVANKKIKNLKFKALKLTWKDYQILNDKYLEKLGIDMIIDLTEKWDAKWGGLVTYTDGWGNYMQVPNFYNSLAIIRRKKGTNRFIQYINHYARNKERIFLIGII